MFSDIKNMVSEVGQALSDRINLVKKETTDQHVPPGTVALSVSSCALVSGELDIKTVRISEKSKFSEVQGLVDPKDGYLYHDGQTLTFKTLNETVFTVPLSQLQVEQKANVGLILTLPDGRRYAIGNSIIVADDKYAAAFKGMSYGEEGHWMKEFARLNVVDPKAYEANVKKSQTVTKIVIAAFVIIIVVFLII